jgi:hypothetical protein
MGEPLLHDVVIEPSVMGNTPGTKIDFVYFNVKQNEWIVGGAFIKETLSQESIALLVKEFEIFKKKVSTI